MLDNTREGLEAGFKEVDDEDSDASFSSLLTPLLGIVSVSSPMTIVGVLGNDKAEGLFSPLPPLSVGVLEEEADELLGNVEEG